MPAVKGHWWGDCNALGVVGAAFVDDADLINGVGVAGGKQLVVNHQTLSSGEGKELGAGWELITVHGVIASGIEAWSWLGGWASKQVGG